MSDGGRQASALTNRSIGAGITSISNIGSTPFRRVQAYEIVRRSTYFKLFTSWAERLPKPALRKLTPQPVFHNMER